uniref:Caveolin n=1 Tax=Globodera pallida TaxID=36090 RepID=A0A183BKP0_GLOPA
MADVELQEQSVPLKSAEQPQATEGTETTTTTTTTTTAVGVVVGVPPQGDEEASSKSKEKKGWFSKKKPQKTDGDAAVAGANEKGGGANNKAAAGAEGVADANNVKEDKQKKKAGKQQHQRSGCPFTLCRAQKNEFPRPFPPMTPYERPYPEPTFQCDLVQRDSAKLQEAIDLGVHDIFGEPDAVHSLNGVWKTALTVFLAVRNFCYKTLSLVFAVPLAVVFGVLFALLSTLSVFVFVPIGRLLSIPFGWLAKLWSVLVSAVCDPLCRSIALICGNVKVSRYGISQDPTAVLSSA